jgi:sugar lactone lactonase YvrE
MIMRRFTLGSFMLLGLLLVPGLVEAQTITTVAGGGPIDLPATTAGIGLPYGVAFDKTTGNIYISGGFTIAQEVTLVNGVPTSQQVRVPQPYVFKVTPSGQVSIYAGNGASAFSGDNGPATSAALNFPLGLAVDGSGNLFIVDYPRIRRVDVITGMITTVAGTTDGFSGDNGPATSAQLSPGGGIAADASGNLFIADTFNNVIRRVDAITQTITTVAGNGTAGFSGDTGLATAAELNNPAGIAVDANDDLFIADTNNCVIRRVDGTSQMVTTVAGIGDSCGDSGDGAAATSAQLNTPFSLALNTAGDIYIADSFNNLVRRVDHSTLYISTVAGVPGTFGFTGDNGLATSAELGLALVQTISGNPFVVAGGAISFNASGDLLIADTANNRVRIVNSDTLDITTLAGNGTFDFGGDGGLATNAELNEPGSMVLDSSGNLFISDEFNSRIRRVDAATGNISTIAGDGSFNFAGDNGPAVNAEISGIFGASLDKSGNLVFADGFNNRIRSINIGIATPVITTIAGNGTGGFSGDTGLAVNAELYQPEIATFDTLGNMFIADAANSRIRRVDAITQEITTVAGNGVSGFTGDTGLAINAELNEPFDVRADASGNLFIADAGNNRIRRVNANTGNITTLAGNGTAGFTGDNGIAISAELNFPISVVPDACDNLFISDTGNYVIRRVDSLSGNITTVSGNGAFGFSGDGGAATSAELGFPEHLFLDSSGNLFYADEGTGRIRRISGLGIMNAASCPNPVPTLTSPLVPNSATAGDPAFTLAVNGSNFISASVVQWNGTALASTFVSATQLTATVPASDIAISGLPAVTVFNPTPGGGTSNPLEFVIYNPEATLTSPLVPSFAVVGSAGFTLTVNGSNFVSTSVVQWNGTALTTSFVNSTQLTAAVPASDIATAGTASVTVFNPMVVAAVRTLSASPQTVASGSGSNALTFHIVDFTLSGTTGPQTVAAGQSAVFTITTASIDGTFPNSVTFTATGLPAGAVVTFIPSSVIPAASTTMTVTTMARTAAVATRRPFGSRWPSFPGLLPVWLATLAVLMLLARVGFAGFQQKPLRRLALAAGLILLIVTAGYLAGCAGGFPKLETSSSGTLAGSYTITVTGTSGNDMHSTTVTLTVQ